MSTVAGVPTTGLELWFRPESLVGLTDGAPIASWPDSSGNARDALQADPAQRPVYRTARFSGYAVVDFDGAQRLAFSGTTTLSSMSLFIVYRYDEPNATSGSWPFTIGGDQDITGQYWGIESHFSDLTNDQVDIYGGFSNDARATFPGVSAPNVIRVLSAVSSGTIHNTTVNVNGQTAAMSTTGSNVALSVPLSGSRSGIGGCCGSQRANVEIAEILLYSSALGTTDRQQVESYLMSRYFRGARAIAASTPNLQQLTVTFPNPMLVGGADDVTDGAHYEISGGGALFFAGSGTRSTDGKSVTLNLSCAQTCQKFASGASYTVNVKGVAEQSGIVVRGSATFTAGDVAPPTLTISQPGPYEFIVTASEPLAQATVTLSAFTWDGGGFPGTVQLQGGDNTFCDLSATDRCAQRIRLLLSPPFPPSGAHTIGLTGLTDLAGRGATPASFGVALGAAPSVTSVTHNFASLTPDASPVSQLQVNFNVAMGTSAGGASSYSLLNPDGSPATTGGASGVGAALTIANVSFDARTANTQRFDMLRARLRLSGLMAPGVAYQLRLSGITDQTGAALDAASTDRSVTNPGDTTPLAVTSVRSSTDQLFVTFNKNLFRNATRVGDPTAYAAGPQFVECATTGAEPWGITAGPDGNLWFTDRTAQRIGRLQPGSCASVTYFTVPGDASNRPTPTGITQGPDGALWFVADSAFGTANNIGRITTAGTISQYPVPGGLNGIATGGDGNLWFPQIANNTIGVLSPTGSLLHEYPIPTGGSYPVGIAKSSDGLLWFAENVGSRIARATLAGSITEYPTPTGNAGTQWITAGPDGNLWFTEYQGNRVGRITPGGVITEFPIPTPNSGPAMIVWGPDDALWFAEDGGNKIGRITTAGLITEYPLPTPNAHPFGIAAGPDGNIWFTERFTAKIGKLVLAGDPTLQASLTGMTAASYGTAERLANYGGAAANGSATAGGAVIFSYAQPLAPGTYILDVSGLTDDLGNALGPDPSPFQFTVTGSTAALTAQTSNLAQLTITYPSSMSTSGATDIQDGAHYELSGGLFLGVGAAAPDGRSATLTLSCAQTCQRFTAGTSYTLNVRGVADANGTIVSGSTAFTPADSTHPTLTLSQPGPFEIVLGANEPLARATVNTGAFTWDGGALPGTVELQGGDGTSCDLFGGAVDRCDQRIRILLSTPAAGAHALGLSGITDVSGLAATPTSFTVTIPTTSPAPTVTSATHALIVSDPAGSQQSQVSIDFSTVMGASAGVPANYTLYDAAGSPSTTNFSVSFDGRSSNIARFQQTRARLIFFQPLTAGAAYTLRLSNIFDHAGRPLDAASTALAITNPGDTASPSVTSARSGGDQLHVTYGESVFRNVTHASEAARYSAGDPSRPLSTDATLAAALNGMTLASFGMADRRAHYDFAGPSLGNTSLDGTGVTFTLSQPLANGVYRLRVSGVTDDAGNPLSPDPTYVTFTVGTAPAVTLSLACGPSAPKSTTVSATVTGFTANSTTVFEVLDGTGAFVFRDGQKTLVTGGYTALFGMTQPNGTYTVRVTEDQNGNRAADAGEPSATATFTVPCADGSGGDPAPAAHQTALYALMTNNFDFDGTAQSAIEIVALSDMRLIRSIPLGSRNVASMAVSADGRRAYVADTTNGAVAVIDLVTGAQLANLATPSVRDVVLAPDGATLYVTTDLKLFAFDTATNAKLRELASTVAGTRTDVFLSIAVSPDGATLSTIGFDGVTHWIYFVRASDLGLLNRSAPSNPGEPSNCSTDPNDVAFVNSSTALFWDNNCDNLYETTSITVGQNTAATIRVGRDDGSGSNYNNALSYSAVANTAYAHTEGIGIGGELRGHVAILDRASASSAGIFGLIGAPFSSALTPDGKSLFVDVISRSQTPGVADRLDQLDTVTKTYHRGVYAFSDPTMSARDLKIGAAPAAVAISGTISDAANPLAKIAGVHVDAIDATCADWTPSCAKYGSTPSDVNGVFRIALPAGQWKLHFQPGPSSFYVQAFYGGGNDFRTATTLVLSGDAHVDQDLALGFRVSGRVTDQAGGGLGGVNVSAWDSSKACCEIFGGVGTDEAGYYGFAVPAGTWKIRFKPQGTAHAQEYYSGKDTFASADAIGGGAGQEAVNVNAALRAAYAVGGRVTDPATGSPVAGVAVRAFLPAVVPPDAVGEARTAADGTYAFGLTSGTYRFVFNGNEVGYVRRFYNGIARGTPSFELATNVTLPPNAALDMALPRGVTVAGQVTDGTSGVPNVVASFEPANGAPSSGFPTDAGGLYSGLIEAGQYAVRFVPADPASRLVPEYWNDKATRATADVVDIQTSSTFNAVLASGFFITGTITGSPGVANVSVTAVSATCTSWTPTCPQYGTRVSSDATGAYRLLVPSGPTLADRDWKLFFWPDPYGPDPTPLYVAKWHGDGQDFSAALPVRVDLDVVVNETLVRGMRIKGTVSVPAPATLPPLGVNAADATQPCCRFIAGAGVRADGTFSFAAPAGSVKVKFFPGDASFASQWLGGTATFGDTATVTLTGVVDQTLDASITLQAGYKITGRVTDKTSGLGLVGVKVSASPSSGPCCSDQSGTALTGADGTYQLASLPGTYRVFFFGADAGHDNRFYNGTANGTSDFNAATDIDLHAQRDGIGVALSAAFYIAGRVLAPDGTTPVANVQVNAIDSAAGCPPCNGVAGARTNASGAYQVLAVPGTYKVKLQPPAPYVIQYFPSAPDFAGGAVVTVTNARVDLGATMLQAGFTLSGRVTDADTGSGLANVNVNVQLSPTPGPEAAGFARSASDGTYAVAVRAGTYRLAFNGINTTPLHVRRFWKDGLTGGTPVFRDATDIIVGPDRAGLDMALPLGYTITGTVTAPDGSHPANVQLSAIDPATGKPGGQGWITDPDGTGFFKLIVPNGTYKVQVIPINGPTTTYLPQFYDRVRDLTGAKTIAVASANVSGIAVTLENGVRLIGQVVDAASRAGIAGITVNAYLGGATDGCSPCTLENFAVTSTDGTFTIYVHANTTYKLEARGDATHLGSWYDSQFAFATATPVPVQTTDVALNSIALTAGAQVSGTVTAATPPASTFRASALAATGIAGVRVRAFSADPSGVCCIKLAETLTDVEGRYSFVVPVGPVKLLFTSTGALPYAATWSGHGRDFREAATLQAVGGTPLTVDMAVPPGIALTGAITDAATGAAIPSGAVRLYRADRGTSVDSVIDIGLADETGRYTVVTAGGTFTRHKLAFSGGPAGYVRQFADAKPSYETADSFTITAPTVKNAALASGVTIRGSLKDRTTGTFARGVIEAYDTGGRLLTVGGDLVSAFAVPAPAYPGPISFVVPSGQRKFRFAAPGYIAVWWNGTVTGSPSAADATVVDTTLSPVPVLDVLLDKATADVALTLAGTSRGGSVGFVASITNTSAVVAATGVHVETTLPSGVTFTGATISGGGTCSPAGAAIACDLARLDPGTTATATVGGTPVATGTFTGSATVTVNEIDPNTGNNSASASTTVETIVTGIARCGTTALPGGVVTALIGTLKVDETIAGRDGSYALYALRPADRYDIRYKGVGAQAGVSCGLADQTTGAAGATTQITATAPPCTDNGNHRWTRPTAISSGVSIADRICSIGAANWYVFAAAPRQRIVIELRDLSAPRGIALFRDIAVVAAADPASGTLADVLRSTAQTIDDLGGGSVGIDDLGGGSVGIDDLGGGSVGIDDLGGGSVGIDDLGGGSVGIDDLGGGSVGIDDLGGGSVGIDDLGGGSVGIDDLGGGSVGIDALSVGMGLTAQDYTSAQKRALLAATSRLSLLPRRVTFLTGEQGGNFYVRVWGGVDVAHDYTVVERSEDAECVGVHLQTAYPLSWTPARTNARSIVVTALDALRHSDGTLLTDTERAALAQNWTAFVTDPKYGIDGYFIDLSLVGAFTAARTQWLTAPGCAPAAQVVAEVVRAVIAAASGPNTKNVQILGNHVVVPHWPVPTREEFGSEQRWNGVPLVGGTRSDATFRPVSYTLSDDPYITTQPIVIGGRTLYIPDEGKAIARAVETVEEIETLRTVFIARNGTLRVQNAFVFGYDFLTDSASAKADLIAGAGVATKRVLQPLGDGPLSPSAWHADAIKSEWTGSTTYQLQVWDAHFNANRMLAADYQTAIGTDQVPLGQGHFGGVNVSAGCHAGYVIYAPDALGRPLDWAQVVARDGGILIANTGYGVGDRSTTSFTERLGLLTVRGLREATGPRQVALLSAGAKRTYFAGLAVVNGTDAKVAAQWTAFGLVWTTATLIEDPAQQLPPDGTITPATTPGASAGLSTASISPTYTFTRHDQTLPTLTAGTSITLSHLDIDGATAVKCDAPVLPLKLVNLSAADRVLRGLVLREAAYTDVSPWVNATGLCATELTGIHPLYRTEVFYPAVPFVINEIVGQSIAITPAQYVSDPTPTLRRLDSIALEAVFSTRTDAAAFAAPPEIRSVSMAASGSLACALVSASVLRSAGLEKAVFTYTGTTGTLAGRWRSVDMELLATNDPGATGLLNVYRACVETAATGAAPGDVRAFIQVVSGTGLVSRALNLGRYYRIETPAVVMQAPRLQDTSVALDPIPSAVPYGGTLQLRATLRSAGPTGQPIAGKPLYFRVGALARSATTAADGTAAVSFPADWIPGTYEATTLFLQDAQYRSSAEARQTFQIARGATSITPTAPPRSVQYSDPFGLGVLRAGTRRIEGYTVVVALTPPGATAPTCSVPLLTDPLGVITFSTLECGGVRPGRYDVTLTFAGNDLLDGSSALTTVDVAPERSTVAFTDLVPPPDSAGVLMRARLTQEQDASAGDPTKATVAISLTTGTSSVSATAPVAADGNASASVTVPGYGVWTVTGTADGYFTSDPATTSLVTYSLCLLYAPNSAKRLGSVVPIKLQICDGAGSNLSASAIALHARAVVRTNTNTPGILEDAGSANPDQNFRYDATLGGTGGYIYNLDSSPLSVGTWVVRFTVGSHPYVYETSFQVK